MLCPGCGRANPEDAGFCNGCKALDDLHWSDKPSLQQFEAQGGRVVDSQGDGFLIVFSAPEAGVRGTVILACRIADQAESQEILVSEDLKDLLGAPNEFRFTSERCLALKGFSGRHTAHRVEWRARQ